MSHSKDPEKTSDDAVKGQVFEDKTTEKDSMLAGVRLPFLHGVFPRAPGGHPSLHLTQLAHPSALPPHLNGLPHHPIAEHHFQGFSAFRKSSLLSLSFPQIPKLITRSAIEYSKFVQLNFIKNFWHLYEI